MIETRIDRACPACRCAKPLPFVATHVLEKIEAGNAHYKCRCGAVRIVAVDEGGGQRNEPAA